MPNKDPRSLLSNHKFAIMTLIVAICFFLMTIIVIIGFEGNFYSLNDELSKNGSISIRKATNGSDKWIASKFDADEIKLKKVFEIFPDIAGLNISHHSIIHLAEDDFDAASNLEILILNHCNIEAIDQNTFKLTTELREIDLSFNRISILPNRLFSGLSLLTKLDLSYNRLECFDIKSLQETHNLSSLNLNGNSLTSIIGLAEIKKIPTLKNLTFAENLMSCKLQKNLESALQFNGLNVSDYCDRNLNQLISIIDLWKNFAFEYKLFRATKNSLELTEKEHHEKMDDFEKLINSLDHNSQNLFQNFEWRYRKFEVSIDHVVLFITLVVVLLFFIIIAFVLLIGAKS